MSSQLCPVCGNYHYGSAWSINQQVMRCVEKSRVSKDETISDAVSALQKLQAENEELREKLRKTTVLLEERTALLDKRTKTIQRMMIGRKRNKIS